MENKYKEYGSVIIITILHGIFTYEFLGRMPYIAFNVISKVTVSAFIMWLMYGIGLYLILQKWMIQVKITAKRCVSAFLFGVGSAIVKGVGDLVVDKLSGISPTVIKVVCINQITTIIFGIILIGFLTLVVAKRKVDFKINRVKASVCAVIIIVVCYVMFVVNYLHQNQAAIREYNANEEEIRNLDYHFGVKIADINVWFYVLFYIAFWWFMRRLTEDSEEKLRR